MKRGLRQNIGRLAAVVLLVFGTAPSAESQGRTVADTRPIWTEYAQYVLFRVRDWLAADNGVQCLRDAKELPPQVTASVWITANGRLDRIVAHSLDTKAADTISHAVEGRALDVPPPDMPQPLRLRFTFKREHAS